MFSQTTKTEVMDIIDDVIEFIIEYLHSDLIVTSDWWYAFFDFREEKEKFILLSQKSRVEIRNYIFS